MEPPSTTIPQRPHVSGVELYTNGWKNTCHLRGRAKDHPHLFLLWGSISIHNWSGWRWYLFYREDDSLQHLRFCRFFENKGACLFISSSMAHSKDTESSSLSKYLLGELYELVWTDAKSTMLRTPSFLNDLKWTKKEHVLNMVAQCYLGTYLLTYIMERINWTKLYLHPLLTVTWYFWVRYKDWFLHIIKILSTTLQKWYKNNHEWHSRNQRPYLARVLWMKQNVGRANLHHPDLGKTIIHQTVL